MAGESKAANIASACRAPAKRDVPGVRRRTALHDPAGTYDELSDAFRALVDGYVATKYPRK